jgi:hypothetical protein
MFSCSTERVAFTGSVDDTSAGGTLPDRKLAGSLFYIGFRSAERYLKVILTLAISAVLRTVQIFALT